MIRSHLPLPFLYRLRLQAGSAANRAQSSLATYRQHRPHSQSSRPFMGHQAVRRSPSGGASGLWEDFFREYESFTGLLCSAAKSGCDARKEAEYAQMRCWFVTNYYRIAARVRPYLDVEFGSDNASEEVFPTVVDYAGQKRALDALESLFVPTTLRDVLRHDQGDLIPRVARVSEAVYRCYADWESENAA